MTALKKDKLSVLYLARWYPNRYDPMPGLFIQRHAEAANLYCKVSVVYVHAIENGGFHNVYQLRFKTINGVDTALVYYNQPKSKIPFLGSLIKLFRFYKANSIGIKAIKAKSGDFNLVHIHILTRLGLIGLYYKWFKNKPYLISEHWSRYLDLTGGFKGIFRKAITRSIVKRASFVTTVTQNLADAMKAHGLKNKNYRVLDNVVDDVFYRRGIGNLQKDKVSFMNVSCFEDRSKNISGILRAIKSLAEKRNDFVLKLVGEGMDFNRLCDYAREMGLDEKQVIFTGLLEGKALADEMANADLMVVFSNYENLPVVINEGFVLGVPVVSTRVGGIPEIVNKNNGVLIERGNGQALEKALTGFLNGKFKFNKKQISDIAKTRFSPEVIGMELVEMYQKAIPE